MHKPGSGPTETTKTHHVPPASPRHPHIQHFTNGQFTPKGSRSHFLNYRCLNILVDKEAERTNVQQPCAKGHRGAPRHKWAVAGDMSICSYFTATTEASCLMLVIKAYSFLTRKMLLENNQKTSQNSVIFSLSLFSSVSKSPPKGFARTLLLHLTK